MAEQENYIENKTFERDNLLKKGEYENCNFNGYDFYEKDLTDYKFIDCVFNNCNLSLARLNKTALRDIQFKDCKIMGVRFDTCNEFGLSFSFEGCILNHSSFYKMKIRKTIFKNSQLQEIDFTEADLTGALFENCNLAHAIFDHTILEKADFRSSFYFSIDPEINQMKKAKFSIAGVTGLLDKYDIIIEK